ncbi:hypothetical protein BLNAU_967 [Blattamonas nauphoetae]|uniref:Uncharacterized protein n=1 Tax=Blattamonas nauphoetae TaxID=2049346 RepID=A0ABQ9YJQ8_9EUKA|nr:hypothetical protein BLNAU_967 [Blattamonas nauphoetae]
MIPPVGAGLVPQRSILISEVEATSCHRQCRKKKFIRGRRESGGDHEGDSVLHRHRCPTHIKQVEAVHRRSEHAKDDSGEGTGRAQGRVDPPNVSLVIRSPSHTSLNAVHTTVTCDTPNGRRDRHTTAFPPFPEPISSPPPPSLHPPSVTNSRGGVVMETLRPHPQNPGGMSIITDYSLRPSTRIFGYPIPFSHFIYGP